jgi:soluble lytic murein transglycosylase-like protein
MAVGKIAGAAFAGFVLAASFSFARAQEPSEFTVLSAKDVSTYGAMFAAEAAGQTAKSDALAETLEDKVLIGYVLQARYLGPRHKSQFAELSAWLKSYAELEDAERVYALARQRAPKNASITRPVPMRWRGAKGEGDAFEDAEVASKAASRLQSRMGSQVRRGNPQAAHRLLQAAKNIPQADVDRLSAYAAFAYLVYAQDQPALSLAEQTLGRNGAAQAHARWTAGLAAYRVSQFERAAAHFSALAQEVGIAERTHSAAAFWAARSAMRAGKPEQVLALYEQAAAERNNFYGLLAARLLGQDFGTELAEPSLDQASFAELMRSGAAKRAVALWQVGRKDAVEAELQRAFGEIDPSLDHAYAALARQLQATSLELRAAEVIAERDIRLTSLYPIPPYGPRGGYTVDQAVLLAFARQESRFQAAAVSRVGARGVMQIMPATAALVAGDRSLARSNRAKLYDPVFSMTLGQDHLRDLLDRQNGNLIALATAYNAGPGNLTRWMALHEGIGDPLLFIETLPAAETRNYIKRVMVNLWMYRKRLGEPMDGLDDAAEGRWPVYVQAVGAAQNQ